MLNQIEHYRKREIRALLRLGGSLAAIAVATCSLIAQSEESKSEQSKLEQSKLKKKKCEESKPELFELSPFAVTGNDDGYRATQTLNGTRLKSDVKDVGAAMTIFTEELMNDLAANSLEDLLNFAPNTDTFVEELTDLGGQGNDFLNTDSKFVTRGGASSVVSQDFVQTGVPSDRFNSERLTFTRGPNSILFGLGRSSGAFISSTKRAGFGDLPVTLQFQVDDRGGFRSTLDVNQVVLEDKLAVRYAGVYEDTKHWLSHAVGYNRRHFVTTSFKPFDGTILRANYEAGKLNKQAIRTWPAYDGFSPWVDAGRPTIATFGGPRPAGVVAYTAWDLVSTEFSPGGTQVPTLIRRNEGVSQRPSFATGYPVSGSFRSVTDEAVFPTDVSLFGGTSARYHDYSIYSLFLEQKITDKFFVELAYNNVNDRVFGLNGLRGNDAVLVYDVNEQLPNGDPNPNVGLFYVQARPTFLDGDAETENARVMMSYDLDFTERDSGWARHLGRHQIALFGEQNNVKSWGSNNVLKNATPLSASGPTSIISHSQNSIAYRFYQEPGKGLVGTDLGSVMVNFPNLYADDPIPDAHPSGITPAFVSLQGPSGSDKEIETKALASQSFFLNGRIVLTNGFRKDTQTSWAMVPGDTAATHKDANNLRWNPRRFDLRNDFPDSRVRRSGDTTTHGIVFHANHSMSFSYNKSNNIDIVAATRDLYGNLLPNPQGEGEDFGARFVLFKDKVFIDVTRYTNAQLDDPDDIRRTQAGDFLQVRDIWTALHNFTDDDKYLSPPYATEGSVWKDLNSKTAKGWEFSVTARPNKRWNITLNGSKRGDSTTTERGVITTRYMNEFLPIIEANPEWMALTAGVNGDTTVGAIVADLRQSLGNFDRIKDLPSGLFAPEWTLNLIQSYRFSKDSLFKGFSVGCNMNARGKAINGFGLDDEGVIDPSIRYYAPGYEKFGAFVKYDRKIFNDKVKWTFQLNVNNLFDSDTLYARRSVDSQDGEHTPAEVLHGLREPRSFRFTNTFKF